MTMQLTFEYGGASPLDLMADGYKVIDGFYPNTPTDPEARVIERIDVHITGSSENDLINKIRALERIFDQARRHQIGPNGVYCNFAPSLTADLWRARVYGGVVLWDSRLDRAWRRTKAIVGITVERAPAWEGPEAQIPLTNPLGSNNTSGLTIYNPNIHLLANTISFDAGTKRVSDSANGLVNFLDGMTVKIYGSTSNDGTYTIDDGGHAGYFVVNESLVTEGAGDIVGIDGGLCNYVEIAAADVEGDLPSSVRLEITNNYNAAASAGTVWIGHNVECQPATLDNILEAEDADGGEVGDVTSSSYATENQYMSASWSGATETVLMTWTLSTALLNKLLGRYVRFLIRFLTSPTINLWMRLKIKVDVTTLWEGPLTLMSTVKNQELISMRLPPYLLNAGDVYPLSLILSGKLDAGEHVINVDFLQMMVLDGWRKLAPKGYNLGYQARLMDDGIDGYLYTDNWTPAGKIGNYVGYGEPIMLHPNRLQRLYFQFTDDIGGGDTMRFLSVKC